ncbi:phage head-binding domain-containing protein [Escherichia coli]|nr:phage head-binding domain-containing protein [Escherichia coli]
MPEQLYNVVVSQPSQLFTLARSFKANANGKIYIGKIDTDPVNPENQIQVYVENEDGSHVPVSQPIIINAAGYPVYNGQIAKFVTVQGHSMAVYDAYGAQQFYFPNVLKYDPDQSLKYVEGALLVTDLGNGTFKNSRKDVAIGDNLTGTNFIRINGGVYKCTPVATGIVTEIKHRYIIAGGVKSYLSHISRHVSGTRRPLNWKLEFSIIDDEITADLKDQYGYTTMGFQGIYIDSNDGMVYIGWQTLDPASVWVTVHDWVTGALVTRLHFPNNVGAPEGIHVYRVAGQRYILLPYSPSRTIRIYPIEDPRTLVDKTQITNFTESTRLGVRYQFSGFGNTLIYENADMGWPKIFDVETGVSNIFNTLDINSLIEGSYSPMGTITVDANVGGRGAGKPKRQGVALGSQRIFAGIGASTTAGSGNTFAGLQGYIEYSLNGSELGQYLLSPADFKTYWDSYSGKSVYSTENEGVQSCDISGSEELYLLQSIRYDNGGGSNYRTLNIIRANCPSNEPGTVDMTPLSNASSQLFNPRGRVINAGRHPVNPADGIALFTSAQAICDYLRNTDAGRYVTYLEQDMPLFEGGPSAPGQMTLPAFCLLQIDFINGDTWEITVNGTNRANNYTGRISKNGGYNSFTKVSSRSMSILGSPGLVDVSIRSPNSLNLPEFAGDWSTGVSIGAAGGVTNWQPEGTGNGALWESGYAKNRVLQIFMSTTSKLFFRYAGDAIRAGNTGWAEAWSSLNTTVDSSGFIKKASPVVKIFSDGSSETNRESDGVTVTRLALGEYLIEGCVGLNADASWGGIDGGFEIPQDRNKQPLIWLDYVVNQDGSVLVKTFHRTHDNSPVFARNDIPGVSNGDPIDIPANQFVSVRVQMPEDSAWNKLKEQLNKAELIEDDVVE